VGIHNPSSIAFMLRAGRASVARTATLSGEFRLKLAIVNMEKGIGNGSPTCTAGPRSPTEPVRQAAAGRRAPPPAPARSDTQLPAAAH